MHVCTFVGLQNWSDHMFEKLGWMTLAARDGNTDTIKGYISGLQHLSLKIMEKHKETINEDRKKDLEELLDNVKYLLRVSKKVLKA